MASKAQDTSTADKAALKRERLAAELRKNLKRRKAKARQTSAMDADQK